MARPNSGLAPPRFSTGSGAGGLIRLLVIVTLFFLFAGQIVQCARELPARVAHTTAQAANGIASGIGNAISSGAHDLVNGTTSYLGRKWDQLANWFKRLFHTTSALWANSTPAEKFKLVCENLPVEGVDKLCAYFAAPLGAATDAQAAQIACYFRAAADGGTQEVQRVANACATYRFNAAALDNCLSRQVEPGDAATCLSTAPEQLWPQLHATIEPIACPPGTPQSWCMVSASKNATNPAPAVRTDTPYLNCLSYYRSADLLYPNDGCAGLNGAVTPSNAACVKQAIATLTRNGMQLGPPQIQVCEKILVPSQ